MKDLASAVFYILRSLQTIFIPLSVFACLSACSTHHNVATGSGYSIPPVTFDNSTLWDYREFGLPGASVPTGLLVGRSKIANTMMKEARLLMQLGYECEWFSVQNGEQKVEHWLVVVGFDDRQQARRGLRELYATGVWDIQMPLIAMPVESAGRNIAARGPAY